jgi:hypothetical protein
MMIYLAQSFTAGSDVKNEGDSTFSFVYSFACFFVS